MCVRVYAESDAEMRGGDGEEAEEAQQAHGCGLAGNLDVLTCRADWLYSCGAYQVAFRPLSTES